jgi:SAM-dependent methyltransferase
MLIPSPPNSGTGIEKIVSSAIRTLNNYFGSGGETEGDDRGFTKKSFEDYFTQFLWFKNEVIHSRAILDIGCSYGRETFALSWLFGSVQAVGIDVSPKNIEFIRRNPVLSLESLSKFLSKYNDSASDFGWTKQYVQEFQAWWQIKVPDNLRSCIENGKIPKFMVGDISERDSIPYLDGVFDLVYCCNVLDELVNEGKDWHSAIRNMATLVKPNAGRIVVIGATERDTSQGKHSNTFISLNDISLIFQALGLELLDEKGIPHLGHLDWPVTKPKGYMYKKRRS